MVLIKRLKIVLHSLLLTLCIWGMASLSVVTTACSRYSCYDIEEAYVIDSKADQFSALVKQCLEDDLKCVDLCLEVLLGNGMYDMEDEDEPQLSVCIYSQEDSTVLVAYNSCFPKPGS